MKALKRITLGSTLLAPLVLAGCSVWTTLKIIAIIATAIVEIHAAVEANPPASALADYDASQASINLQFVNSSVADTTGNVTMTIKDQGTGAVLGQRTFAYTITANNQLRFSNPSVVSPWVQSFSDYGGLVTVEYDADIRANRPPSGESGSVSSTAVYSGTAYASSMIHIERPDCRYPSCVPP